jgi:hypothetical protein
MMGQAGQIFSVLHAESSLRMRLGDVVAGTGKSACATGKCDKL